MRSRLARLKWQVKDGLHHGKRIVADVGHRILGPWTLARSLSLEAYLSSWLEPTCILVGVGLHDEELREALSLVEKKRGAHERLVLVSNALSFDVAASAKARLEYIPDRECIERLDLAVSEEDFLKRRLSHLSRAYGTRKVFRALRCPGSSELELLRLEPELEFSTR